MCVCASEGARESERERERERGEREEKDGDGMTHGERETIRRTETVKETERKKDFLCVYFYGRTAKAVYDPREAEFIKSVNSIRLYYLYRN